MDETAIDRTAMGRLAKALVFICGADHPTTVALAKAAETGTDSVWMLTPVPEMGSVMAIS